MISDARFEELRGEISLLSEDEISLGMAAALTHKKKCEEALQDANVRFALFKSRAVSMEAARSRDALRIR